MTPAELQNLKAIRARNMRIASAAKANGMQFRVNDALIRARVAHGLLKFFREISAAK